MTLTRRDVFLLIFLMIALAIGGYYTLFFVDINEEMTRISNDIVIRESDIEAARGRVLTHAILTAQLAYLEEEWQEAMDGVPDDFNDIYVIRTIQGLVYHFTPELQANVTTTTTYRPGGLSVNGVRLDFITDRLGLEQLLNDIWQDEAETRIITYVITPETEAGQYGQIRVSIYIEFLTVGGRY